MTGVILQWNCSDEAACRRQLRWGKQCAGGSCRCEGSMQEAAADERQCAGGSCRYEGSVQEAAADEALVDWRLRWCGVQWQRVG
jgi:hypothetical protein